MKGTIYLKGLLIGGGLAVFLTMAGLFLISFWIGFGSQPVYYLVNNLFFLTLISIVTGGFWAGYNAGIKGWLHGLIIGIFYTCLFLTGPQLWLQGSSWETLLNEAFFYTAITAFAGVAGVNYQAYRIKRRRRVRRMY